MEETRKAVMPMGTHTNIMKRLLCGLLALLLLFSTACAAKRDADDLSNAKDSVQESEYHDEYADDESDESETPRSNAEEETVEQTHSEIVYITDTGTKYHRDGCQYLRKSQIPIDEDDAIARGYTACSKCF